MRRRKVWPSASDARDAGDSAGRKRRLVLMLEWLTLWPTIGPTPVSSQRRDMGCTLARIKRGRDRSSPSRERCVYRQSAALGQEVFLSSNAAWLLAKARAGGRPCHGATRDR